MIIKDDGLRYAKLIHVSVDNGNTFQSNKVYIMEEQSDGTIKCSYGRIGSKMTIDIKNSSKWNSTYNQKTSPRKGYVDKTDEAVIKQAQNSTGISNISEAEVQKLFDDLMAYDQKSIGTNYKITQNDVTQKQVDNAQSILDAAASIANSSKNKSDKIKPVNEKLLELYATIPRKMGNVKDFLVNKDDYTIEGIKEFLANEQSILDTMAGQVAVIAQKAVSMDDEGDSTQDTLLDKMGLEVIVEKDKKAIALVTKLLGRNSHQLKTLYKCINTNTQKKFDDSYSKSKHKKRKLLWHGSRNENIFNLLTSGMLIRPSGAVHTGSMFGDGIYAASRAKKSIGYTSLSGSYWAGGTSNKGYLLLYDIHLGNQKHIYKHDYSCYSLNNDDLKKEGYDSVFAHGGIDLRNDEFIIYDINKCTIAYIIEITN